MRVPQPDIIEHFGNADAVPHTEPQRGASERNRRLRRLLARRSAGAVLKPSGGNCAVLPYMRDPCCGHGTLDDRLQHGSERYSNDSLRNKCENTTAQAGTTYAGTVTEVSAASITVETEADG